ncbi:MAG: hypothetical protein ACTSVA_02350 [Candidatus Njordarchaeales archaeon]
MKYTIRGLKEGLWYEVVVINDESEDINEIISGGKVVASFEIGWSNRKGKFVVKKLIFNKRDLSTTEKNKIFTLIKDFVESLNL